MSSQCLAVTKYLTECLYNCEKFLKDQILDFKTNIKVNIYI